MNPAPRITLEITEMAPSSRDADHFSLDSHSWCGMNGFFTFWSPLAGCWMSAPVAKALPVIPLTVKGLPENDETSPPPDEDTAPDTLRDLPPPTLRAV